MPSDHEAPDWWDDVETADRADMMVNTDTRREYFRIKRPGWEDPKGAWVELQDPPWNKKKSVLSECIEAREDGSGDLDLAKYYRMMLDYMMVDASFDFKNAETLLRGLNDESGSTLEGFVPAPSARGLTEAEEGKSDEQSEEDGGSGGTQ